MKNILTEALVNSATNASFIFSYTNSAKLRIRLGLVLGCESIKFKKCIFGNFLFKMAFFRAFYKYADCFYSFTVYAFKNDCGL